MPLTRRELLAAAAAVPLSERQGGWGPRWDREVIQAAAERLRGLNGPRESLEYALMLLELGGSTNLERASSAVDRVLEGSDPAAFGVLHLTIEFRHGARLDSPLRSRVREAIRRAVAAVRQRNTPATGTSAAAETAFVTLAAAELFSDAELARYAGGYLTGLARAIDRTGSFAEYNSPSRTQSLIANLTRLRMFVKDQQACALARRIEDRAWLHLSKHWHAPTGKLAGPISVCDEGETDRPAWLQKALPGALALLDFDEIRAANVPGEVGILELSCPAKYEGAFRSVGTAHEHREVFAVAPSGVLPLQGATWLEGDFCLGSVNAGKLHPTTRPLLAYWTGIDDESPHYLRPRLLKDDADAPEAVLYCVQYNRYILGLATFCTADGETVFTCSRLRLRFEMAGVPENAPMLVNHEPADPGEFPAGSRIAVDLGGTYLWLKAIGAACGEPAGRLSIARENGMLTASIELLNSRERREIRRPAVAYAAFALTMQSPSSYLLTDFDEIMRVPPIQVSREGSADVAWDTPDGAIGLTASVQPRPIQTVDRIFREIIHGKPAPLVRLSDEKLVP